VHEVLAIITGKIPFRFSSPAKSNQHQILDLVTLPKFPTINKLLDVEKAADMSEISI